MTPPTTAMITAAAIATIATGLRSSGWPAREKPKSTVAVPIKKPQSEAKLK